MRLSDSWLLGCRWFGRRYILPVKRRKQAERYWYVVIFSSDETLDSHMNSHSTSSLADLFPHLFLFVTEKFKTEEDTWTRCSAGRWCSRRDCCVQVLQRCTSPPPSDMWPPHCFLGFTPFWDKCGVFVRTWRRQTDRIWICLFSLSFLLFGSRRRVGFSSGSNTSSQSINSLWS